jgi:hypothetical protein
MPASSALTQVRAKLKQHADADRQFVKVLGAVCLSSIMPTSRLAARYSTRSPDRLREVNGIGPVRTASILAAWAEQKAVREIR